MNDILEKKEINQDGFTIVISLIADYNSGFTQFSDKWTRDNNGLIIGDDDLRWGCTWYDIGQLNKGNDITVYKAQKEFNRDCNAFDVLLNITVLKNNIELINDVIIGDDHSYDDERTSLELMNYLISDYLDVSYHLDSAKKIIKELMS